MHISDLQSKKIEFDKIFLDPNNPRFWTDGDFKSIPDKKISDASVQNIVFSNMKSHNIEELKFSILRNGFLPLDRIVVRPIGDEKYVVVEGNRRFAALKLLKRQIEFEEIKEQGIDDQYLKNILESIEKLDVLVYEGDENSQDVTWMLQGIRHIGGIKRWEPAQSAKLLAEQIEHNGVSFSQAGQSFGISAREVGKRYRAFKALEQMKSDDEYASIAENNYYSLFEQAISKKDVKNWLEWDDENYKFQNKSNLKDFYGWITPNGSLKGKINLDGRKINDPKQISKLADLIRNNQVGLLSEDLHIDDAYSMRDSPSYNWNATFDNIIKTLGQIPTDAYEEQGFVEKADEVKNKVKRIIKMARSAQDD